MKLYKYLVTPEKYKIYKSPAGHRWIYYSGPDQHNIYALILLDSNHPTWPRYQQVRFPLYILEQFTELKDVFK